MLRDLSARSVLNAFLSSAKTKTDQAVFVDMLTLAEIEHCNDPDLDAMQVSDEAPRRSCMSNAHGDQLLRFHQA